MDLVSLETLQDIALSYGYWAIALGVLLENSGLPIPGETMTLVGGFLAGSGELNIWLVLTSAIGGAVVGDSIGYWLGFYGGWPLVLKIGQLFNIKVSILEGIRARFQNNMRQAVVVGRFIALLRIFAGPMAGIVKMPYPEFFVCNAIGAILWAGLMTGLAFFVGNWMTLEVLMQSVSKGAIALCLGIGLWVGIKMWRDGIRQQKMDA